MTDMRKWVLALIILAIVEVMALPLLLTVA
jgi:hypothetical protein